MSFMLGNLDVAAIEKRSGVTFPEKLVEFMLATHQPSATKIRLGKWHCFDAPFTLVCGDVDTATIIYEHLRPLTSQFVCKMHIYVQG